MDKPAANGDGNVWPPPPWSPPSFGHLQNSSLNSLRLRRVFDLFDGNCDGELTAEELLAALRRLGLDADSSELSSTVASFLKPGRSGLDFDDFEVLHRALGDELLGDLSSRVDDVAEDGDLREAFKVFDMNGDGYISARELQEVLGKLGFVEGQEIARVENMIGCFDRNSDGQVDFGEFRIMMKNLSIKGACA